MSKISEFTVASSLSGTEVIPVVIDPEGTPENKIVTINTIRSGAMGTVVHGGTASASRPTGFTIVTWIGTVEPLNATTNDIWVDVS